MLLQLDKSKPIIKDSDLSVIRKGKDQHLIQLYKFTNDPVQKILLEHIFFHRGIVLEEEKDIA